MPPLSEFEVEDGWEGDVIRHVKCREIITSSDLEGLVKEAEEHVCPPPKPPRDPNAPLTVMELLYITRLQQALKPLPLFRTDKESPREDQA